MTTCDRCGKASPPEIHTCTATPYVARLEAEVERLTADARRYRWVRDGGYLLIEEDRGIGPTWPNAADVDRLVDGFIEAALRGEGE